METKSQKLPRKPAPRSNYLKLRRTLKNLMFAFMKKKQVYWTLEKELMKMQKFTLNMMRINLNNLEKNGIRVTRLRGEMNALLEIETSREKEKKLEQRLTKKKVVSKITAKPKIRGAK